MKTELFDSTDKHFIRLQLDYDEDDNNKQNKQNNQNNQKKGEKI